MLKYQLFSIVNLIKADVQYLKRWVSCDSSLQVRQVAV